MHYALGNWTMVGNERLGEGNILETSRELIIHTSSSDFTSTDSASSNELKRLTPCV
jgi:hypothetical protein